MTVSPTIKQFSAWLPLTMSFAALATVLGHVILFGTAPAKQMAQCRSIGVANFHCDLLHADVVRLEEVYGMLNAYRLKVHER